jgi:hypothetical protein
MATGTCEFIRGPRRLSRTFPSKGETGGFCMLAAIVLPRGLTIY